MLQPARQLSTPRAGADPIGTGQTGTGQSGAGLLDAGTCGPATANLTNASPAEGRSFDFFTNFGSYMPRVDCMQTAAGEPDWPWIGALLALLGVVTVGYARIFWFWRRAYLAEREEDRNHKLMQLAWIFLFCALCGYATSALMFVWPAYRLVVVLLLALAFWTWKFAANLDDFSLSLKARRLERELRESLESRTTELEDLVGERTAELELARATADEASAAKSMFLANMSHEIRSPVTAMIGFAELAKEPGCTDAERTDHLDTIHRNAKHLVKLINDILDISKIEASELRIERQPCSIREIAEDIATIERPRAEARKIGFELHIDDAIPDRVVTDPTRFRQVLVNLCDNAIKFTSRGRVTLELASHPERPQTIVCSVTDTGIGMTPEQLATVFDPFMQADESATREFGGTGLGLTICRRLTELLGGQLTSTSEPGVGTTMTATIAAPAATAATETPAPSEPSKSAPRDGALAGKRVLIADDGPDNQRLLAFHCTKAKADIEIVDNGEAAVLAVSVAAHSSKPFDLVLMDVQMPLMDGLDATRRIRSKGFTLPIIAVTANATTNDQDKCLAAGCDGFLAKPFQGRALLQTVQAVLDHAGSIGVDRAGGPARDPTKDVA